MKMIQLITRNIHTLIHDQFVAFLLFIMGIIISSVTILYSIGKVYSMADYLSDEQCYTLTFDNSLSFGDCKDAIMDLSNEISKIANFRVTVGDGSVFAMKEPWDYAIQYGTGFDSTSEPQIVIGELGELYGEIGSFVEVNNTAYRIVGQRAVEFFNEINYASLTDNTAIQMIEILLKPVTSDKQINTVGVKISSAFPNAKITKPEPRDYLSYFLSDPQFFIAVSLTILAILNLTQLYRYFLNKRKNMYAIYQICGCNKTIGFMIFFTEMEFLSLIPYFGTLLCYKLFIEKILVDEYYYDIFLSSRQLCIITGIFLILQLLLFTPLIRNYSKATPKQLKYTYEVD